MSSQETMEYIKDKTNKDFDVDSIICLSLGIPGEIYKHLPGKEGAKFFSQKEYDDLKNKGITVADIKNAVEVSSTGSLKTIHFKLNNRIISYNNLLQDDSHRVGLGRITSTDKNFYHVEQEYFEYGKYDDNLELMDYRSQKAEIGNFSHNYDLDRVISTIRVNSRGKGQGTYLIDDLLVGNMSEYAIPLTWDVQDLQVLKSGLMETSLNGQRIDIDKTNDELYNEAKEKGVSFSELLQDYANSLDNPSA